MEKLDVVIVGAGLAGLSCAYRLANEGLQVIVVERGDAPGSKNVTGGRLYLKPIRELVGNMLDGAPYERKVARERWGLLGQGNSLTVDFYSERFALEDHSYTVLRANLDRWLSEKLLEKGVFVIPRYRVDELLWEGDTVAGVRAGEEELYAHVVVAADGVLSFMATKAGLRERMKPRNYAVGIKEIIELPEEKIDDRFNLEAGEGCAQLFLGDVTKGLFGGGFLYTNRSSLSIGVVAGIKGLMSRVPALEAHSLLDEFKKRPEIKRLIQGGSLGEYSAHIIPEAGYGGLSKLFGNGIIVTGDAAGFALNMGVTVRGMDFAIASGIIAAEAVLRARQRGSYSAEALSWYQRRLKETFVLKDLESCKAMPAFIENDAFFNLYPKSIPHMVEQVMWFGEGQKDRMGKTVWGSLRGSGILSWRNLKDLYGIKDI
jgi:electron transfer flavoprotein-quinone oxidoreductase